MTHCTVLNIGQNIDTLHSVEYRTEDRRDVGQKQGQMIGLSIGQKIGQIIGKSIGQRKRQKIGQKIGQTLKH